MASNSVSFLTSLTAGRQSASNFDRLNGESMAASVDFIESCPAGVRCPFRTRCQVEVNKNNSLSATTQVLGDSNKYLQSKCDTLAAENDRLRQELVASERSALVSHSQGPKSPLPIQLASTAGQQQWRQQVDDMKDDLRQLTEDKQLLLAQVRMLQESLEKMTHMNEDLLRHLKQAGHQYNSRTASTGHNGGNSRASSQTSSPAQPRQHHSDRRARSTSSMGNTAATAWGAALAGPNSNDNQEAYGATYLYGGHKGYPESLSEVSHTPQRFGPRDTAKLTAHEPAKQNGIDNTLVIRSLTSDMSGVNTEELLRQQLLEKNNFMAEQTKKSSSTATGKSPNRSLPLMTIIDQVKPDNTEKPNIYPIDTSKRSTSRGSESSTSAMVKPMIEALKVLDGVLPPQQPSHYRLRDGTVGRTPSIATLGLESEDGGLNESFRSSTTESVKANSSRRPSRALTTQPKAHDLAVPEEGRENIYSRLRLQGPTKEQGAPFVRGPAGRPTTPNRDGGNDNPLWGGSSPPRGSHATSPLQISLNRASKPDQSSKNDLTNELVGSSSEERNLQNEDELKELRNQQEVLQRKESVVRPKPDLSEDDIKRQPRRTDSALLSTRLVKKERVVFLRIPGRELYLEMLLKDGAGITRRTHSNHPQKGLSSVWTCFFKK